MMDAAMVFVWLVVLVGLVRFLWARAQSAFPRDSFEIRVLSVLVWAWSLEVLLALMLGAVGQLGGHTLLGGLLLAVVGLAIIHRMHPAATTASERAVGWEWACALLVAIWFGHALSSGLAHPPDHWDSLAYHIPLLDRWLQSGSLCVPDFSHWSHPGNNELAALWCVAPVRGDYCLVFANLIPASMLLFGSFVLATEAGFSKGTSYLCSMMVCLNIIVFAQIVSFENDLTVAALTICSLAFGLRYLRLADRGSLLGWAASIGLCAGVKFYALGYVGVVGLVILFTATRKWGWRVAAQLGAAACAGVALLAGYWYVRNWGMTGSPLYPMEFGQDGQDQLSHLYPNPWRSTLFGNGDPSVPRLAFTAIWKMGGPVPLLALGLVPLSITWLLFRGSRPDRLARQALAMAMVGSLGIWLVTPFSVECQWGELDQLKYERTPVRYGLTALSFLTIAAVGSAMMLGDRLRKTEWVIGGLGAILLIQFAIVVVNPDRGLTPEVMRGFQINVVDTALITANLLILWWVGKTIHSLWPRWGPWGLTTILLLSTVAGVGYMAHHWDKTYADYYDTLFADKIVSYLEKADPSLGTRICVLDDRPYPFFGKDRRFEVVTPLALESPESLWDFLQHSQAEWLVTRTPETPFPTNVWHNREAPDWTETPPSDSDFGFRLKRAYSGRSYRLFRVEYLEEP